MNRVFIEPNFAAWVIGATVQSYFVGLVEQNQRNSDTDMIHARYLRLWDAKKLLPDKGGGSNPKLRSWNWVPIWLGEEYCTNWKPGSLLPLFLTFQTQDEQLQIVTALREQNVLFLFAHILNQFLNPIFWGAWGGL